MINILFISQYLNVAGTETFMMNVIRKINRSKFHVDFLIFSNEETRYSEEAESLGARIHRLPCRREGVKYYKKLNDFFKKQGRNYHAIHFCGGNISSIAPIYMAYKYHIPIRIIHSHNSSCDGIHNKLLHAINRLFLPILGTHYFACSIKAAHFFFGKRKCDVIKNGIDVDKYAYDEQRRMSFRQKNGISEKTAVVGHIGRFEAVKNHDMVLAVFQHYHKLNPDSLLILVGTGSLFEKVKEKVGAMGLLQNVLFLGERSDIPDILCCMDCFLMPSFYEGLPFVLVEAQASGLPCVVSNTVNYDAKIIPNLKFLSLKDDPIVWAEAMIDSIKKNDRNNAIEFINKAGYNLASTITFLENVYGGA